MFICTVVASWLSDRLATYAIVSEGSVIHLRVVYTSVLWWQFNKEHGDIHEAKLKVIYVAPAQPPSPVAESAEEGPLGVAEVK